MTDQEKMVSLIVQAKAEDPETGSFTEFLAGFSPYAWCEPSCDISK